MHLNVHRPSKSTKKKISKFFVLKNNNFGQKSESKNQNMNVLKLTWVIAQKFQKKNN